MISVGIFTLDGESIKKIQGLRMGAGDASGRAGQHFDHLRCSCPIWHASNSKVMPRVSYEHGILKVML